MNINKWFENNKINLKNKRVVLTGATGGLGREVCKMLAHLQAKITIVCRNKSLAEKLILGIKSKYKNADIDFVQLDLNNIENVKNCINELKKYNGIDILINNAAVYNVPLSKSQLGVNNVFQINFVSTYFLTKQLLSELGKKENSICITLGSIAYNYSKINESDIDFSLQKKAGKIYGNSKRYLMLSLFKLFEGQKTKLAIVHPGITLTNMTSHYPKAINWLVKAGVKVLFPPPQKAALNIFYATQNIPQKNEWVGPRLFNIWSRPKVGKIKNLKSNEERFASSVAENYYEKMKNFWKKSK